MSSSNTTFEEPACLELPGLHRCLTVVLEWFCGHTEQLDPMEGDCPTPDDTNLSHHIPERLTVQAETPCPVCDSATRSEKLQCHVHDLETKLEQCMADQGFFEWQADNKHVPVDFWRTPSLHTYPLSPPAPYSKSPALSTTSTKSSELQKHLFNIEAFLHGGFGILPSGYTAPTLETSVPGQRKAMTNPHPKRRYKVLRGQSAFRREFVPGVWWMESRLSRSQSALRRDQWRWDHGLLKGQRPKW